MIIAPEVKIIRIEDAFPDGSFGNLLISGRYFCVTLEPPEFDNMKNFGCIPPGQYECEKFYSKHFEFFTYQIKNVPFRDSVEFHPLNWSKQTKACIGPGQYIDREKNMIRNSKMTFDKFMEIMKPYDKFKLTIKEAWA